MKEDKKLEELLYVLNQYYKDKAIPCSVSEYIADYPKGYSRQVLKSRYGLTTAQLLELLNTNYSKPKRVTPEVIQGICANLDYKVLNISGTTAKEFSVVVECVLCGKKHTTTYESLRGSSLGCRYCKSKNISYKEAPERLKPALDRVNGTVVSSIPDNQTGFITLRHNACGAEYTCQLVGLVSPSTPERGTCPNCRNTDRRRVYKGLTFGSWFEEQCYQVFEKFGLESRVKLQTKYSELTNTSRRWTADFVIDNVVIEVSNFKTDYKNYFANISEKAELILNQTNLEFLFITEVKELEIFLSKRYSLNF